MRFNMFFYYPFNVIFCNPLLNEPVRHPSHMCWVIRFFFYYVSCDTVVFCLCRSHVPIVFVASIFIYVIREEVFISNEVCWPTGQGTDDRIKLKAG
jgi:hypothetical protein